MKLKITAPPPLCNSVMCCPLQLEVQKHQYVIWLYFIDGANTNYEAQTTVISTWDQLFNTYPLFSKSLGLPIIVEGGKWSHNTLSSFMDEEFWYVSYMYVTLDIKRPLDLALVKYFYMSLHYKGVGCSLNILNDKLIRRYYYPITQLSFKKTSLVFFFP